MHGRRPAGAAGHDLHQAAVQLVNIGGVEGLRHLDRVAAEGFSAGADDFPDRPERGTESAAGQRRVQTGDLVGRHVDGPE